MSLLTLPSEILTIIVRKLDVTTLLSLAQTCKYLHNLIHMPGVVQSCRLSMNTFATVRSFKLTFFRDISGHLRTLDLSGVNDLTSTTLVPILKKLKNLKYLDVSFTKITIPQYLVIIAAVPTLKSIVLNFSFVGNHRIDNRSLLLYQQGFASLKNVHFVGRSTYLVDNLHAICFLQKADLCNIKFTICTHHSIECGNLVCDLEKTIQMNVSHLQIYFMADHFDSVVYEISESRLLSFMDFSKYEILIFQTLYSERVFATPLLEEFISKNFNVVVDSLAKSKGITGGAALMFWNKDRIQFNSEFYGKLLSILKEHLVFKFAFTEVSPVPKNYKRYWVKQYTPGLEEFDSDIDFDGETLIKKARLRDRLSGKSFILNYDQAFKEKEDNFRLEVWFLPIFRPVSLHPCQYLKKLSHLVLHHGSRFTPTFFKTLFQSCTSLVTLEMIRLQGIVASPLKFISHSASLKNVLLHIKGSHLYTIFKYLSECGTLENIHLVNTSHGYYYDNNDPLPDPMELFTRCKRLYNFCYQSYLNKHQTAEAFEEYKNVRDHLGKYGLNIDMYRYSEFTELAYRYTPHVSVFDIFRFKPI